MNKLMMTAAVVVTAASAFAGKVVLDEDISSAGTVTGVNKDYKANAKVTLKATAKKDYVFTGWTVDAELNEDFRSTTVTFKTPESFGADDTINVTASFKKVAEVENPAPTLDPAATIDNFSVGGDVFPTVTVKGLPSGMKFDAKKIAFTGEPSKPGLYTVTVSAKNSLGYVAEQVYTLLTDEPDRASVGDAFNEGEAEYLGNAGEFKSITVSGLPAGVKLVKLTKDEYGEKVDPAEWYLQGAFTKAGQYATTIKKAYKEGGYDPEVEDRLYIVSNKDDDEIFTDFIAALKGEGEGSREVGESLSTEKSDFALDEDGLGVKSISVSGLPTGIKLVKGAAIKSADGKKTLGYKYSLEGMFTKIGEFNVVFTANVVDYDSEKDKNVTKTKKQYATITVGSAKSVNIALKYGGDEQIREYVGGDAPWTAANKDCTVTGAGVYTPVQKVTLTAKPAKNYLINGWYKSADDAAFSYKNAFSEVAVTVGSYIDNGAFVAFICATNDIAKANPKVDVSKNGKFDGDLDPAGEFKADEDYIDVVVSAPAEIKSVTFKGVPSGLKVTNKDGKYFITVSNAKQLKPGTYAVTALVKTALNTKGVEVKVGDDITVKNLVDDNGYITPSPINVDGNGDALYVNKTMVKFDVTGFVSDPDLFAFSASGLPAGLKLVKTTDKETKEITYTIEGTPKKAGTTTVTYTAKAGGKTYTATEQIVVQESPMVNVTVNPAKSGTITGAEKRYDFGSTVKLTAKPAAGYVFDGWYAFGIKFAQELTVSKEVEETDLGNDINFEARFITLEEAEAAGINVSFKSDSGIAGWGSDSVSTNVAGVAYKMDIGISSKGAVTVTASGLPTGLKLVKDEQGFYTVEGVPTKAGSFKTKFVLKSAGAQKTQYVNYEILPLPTWAAASFVNGYGDIWITNAVKGAEDPLLMEVAEFTAKIDAKGALTGSLVTYKYVESKDDYVKDKTIALKASSATSVTIVTSEGDTPVTPYVGCVCYSNLEAKVGKDVYKFHLVVTGESLDTPCLNWAKGAALWGTINATICPPEAWGDEYNSWAVANIDVMNKKTGYDFTAKNIAEVKKQLGENETLKEIPEFKVISIDATGRVKYSYKSSEDADGRKAKTVTDCFLISPNGTDIEAVDEKYTYLTGSAFFLVNGTYRIFIVKAKIGVDAEDKSYVEVSVDEADGPEEEVVEE